MKFLKTCLLALACGVLPGLDAPPCAAQDKLQFLHPGLLAFTSDELEEKAAPRPSSLPGPGAGKEAAGGRSAEYRLRIGGLYYKNDVISSMIKYASDPGIVPLLGISIEGAITDHFSTRGTLDLVYGFGTFRQEDTEGNPMPIWIDGEFALLAVKYTALLHPARGGPEGKKFGYWHPYIGLGVEYNWFSQTVDVNNRDDVSVVFASHAHGFGVHAVGGVEYVFDGWSLGLELSWSAVEVDFGKGDASLGVVGGTDAGGTSALFTIGYNF
ncbi:MAG: hypothetical protein VX675_02045 [Planctomycetota bacterium]|nr:hypothetical protein [Planctomycetota bacterium]